MLEHKYTRDEYIQRKEKRKQIYEIVFAFVDLSDDYWISFKKLRKVLKHTDDLDVFFAPFVGKDGTFIAAKLEEFIAILDEKFEIAMEEQRKMEAEEAAKAKSGKKKKSKDSAIKVTRPSVATPSVIKRKGLEESEVTPEGDTAPRKRIRRVRLTEEQLKELEKLRREKNQQ
ncbi:MAG: hypothetical protein LBR17_06990 [Bacteroidales bacterium]|jgi:hypothetical protein|nr:hypothetical protein [Bacteroidales bacterium]